MSRAGPSKAAAARAPVATPPCTLLIVRPPRSFLCVIALSCRAVETPHC